MASQSNEFFELFDGQPGIASNTAHRESVDRVVPRNRQDANTVGHNDMFALAHDMEASFFERAHRFEMINARNFRHVTPLPLLHGHLAL